MRDADHPLAPPDDRSTDEADRADDPDCQVDGCDRPGAVPRTFRGDGSDEPTTPRYVCRFHHRVFVGVRALVLALLIVVFLVAFFRF
ncbi:hypothetical protein [Halovivax sp.]|uniref:hypothetical protein n=1 Tax=Halovivax sp. TaxID=1935978 RepID=UPI0025C5163C|nr:hypothetical protein [Halovivax sp.]